MPKSTFTDDYRAFTRLLRETRERAGVTQVELAKKLKQTQSYVSKVERGERRLDLVQLKWWCAAMGTTVTAFVREFEKSV
ncbi:MAG: helix-turn-helix transcriptional regulator [Planctomycetaceae bacterium]|nr:helix-turn-helix transcriptional regulator [Planctomycetaceae bacterium]